jgi:cytochrome d ubiquinol oxidase subunit I
MDALTAARIQMELSLGFHMIFAALGIGMPLLMVLAERRALRTGDDAGLALARTWGKATALLFVVGAVSGTALSFELGLLWPKFMAFAGPVIGPAFALEGYAFLIEAIFIGLYLYGWDRMSPRAHWLAGIPVAISGALSGILVVGANAWMQSPRGYTLDEAGRVAAVDVLATFRNPSWVPLALHSTLSCYIAVGFAVAGVYAIGILRGRDDARHRRGLGLGLGLGTITALLQPLSGDWLAKLVGRTQPEKLAAMEALHETTAGAPLLIGGIPDRAGQIHYGIEIPKGLSFLATGDPNATIRGLASFPVDERPNALVCHLAFQVMVGGGFALVAVGLLWLVLRRRLRKSGAPFPRWFLWIVALASPLGFLALEAGWIVTEVGRQPWIVYRAMRTADAVTPRSDVGTTLAAFGGLYLALGVALIVMLRGLAKKRGGEGA